MDIVDLDIILAQAPGGYTARGVTRDMGSTNASPMGWDPLLGTVSLPSVFTPGFALPENPLPFLQALSDLQGNLPLPESVDTVGQGLYAALPAAVRDLYNLVLGAVRTDTNKLLRIRLHFDAPELALLPWEYVKVDDVFLGARPRQSLIRYPEVSDPVGALGISGPLKILVWASNPEGVPALDFQKEVDNITQALKSGLGTDTVIDLVRTGGPRDLLLALRRGYHVLHYIGHGRFDGEGMLAFQRTDGAPPSWVTADMLVPSLLENPMLKLVFLNSCETAQGGVNSAYASLAFNLARFVPAIIAMQYPVPDDAAIIFSQDFYQAFASGAPLDVGVTNGRQSLIAEYGIREITWGIPALFTRSITGTVVSSDTVKTPSASRQGTGTTGNGSGTNGNTAAPPTTAPVSSGASELNPEQTARALRSQVVDLLVQAFPNRSDVALLTNFYLNTSLDSIPTTGNDLRSLFDSIYTYCLAQGGDGLARLIDGAIQERPARTDLKALRSSLVAAGLINTQVATLSNGRLTLTPSGRRLFTQTILGESWAASQASRDQLLTALPPNLRNSINRSSIAQLDISAILSTAEAWGRMTGGQYDGKYPLIVVAETAAALSGFGSDGAPPSAGTFMGLANAIRAVVGQPPASQPLAD